MALRYIVEVGDSVLEKRCREVTDFNARLHTLLDDMRDTLLDSGGVGLAAPQVGVLRRVVLVMDTNQEGLTDEEQIIELINPEIVSFSGQQTGAEGCLSNPGKYGVVTRPEVVTVKAFDRDGNPFEVTGTGLTARCFCHEIDHLEGRMFMELAERMLTDEELAQMYGEEEESEE
ncbi:MAG: peptide deformylase [Oscillospiraceae bacterium]|nr:peptide deformylase [Oscillospiraceae bacterium]